MTAIDTTAAPPTGAHATDHLPVHLTGFVGRARELSQLESMLVTSRLLTLTGAGGSGKTRLAREAARLTAAHFARVAWVDLAPIEDSAMVATEIAKALGIPEHANMPTVQRVASVLQDERTLLILDNCEHVVDTCAHVTEDLLVGCRMLTVLATSREALGVIGETAWLVPRLDDGEAAQLFVERARAAVPSFTLSDGNRDAIEQICTRLDGIPLAIELAAARVRVLSPKQIAARLDDVFGLLTVSSRNALPRHRTLRSTMEWSFALLSAREQVLQRRLAVFSGSFSLEAAEAVCADAPNAVVAHADSALEPHDVLDGVAALVDKSLLVMEPGDDVSRYRLLETVRQYGMERLVEANELSLMHAQHARYFLAFAQSFAPSLVGGEQVPGLLARVARENDNLRVAAEWAAADESRSEQALEFADALFWYWYGTGYWLRTSQFNEARDYVAEAIARGHAAPASLRGRVLIAQGLTRLAQGQWVGALESFDAALELLRPFADPTTIAIALSKKGAALLNMGRVDEAREAVKEAREWARGLPLGMVHAFVLFWQGFIELHDRDIDALRVSRAEVLLVSRAMEQHRTTHAHHSGLMARGEMMIGQLDEAARLLRDAWTLHQIVGDGWGLTQDLECISMYLAHQDRIEDGVRVMGATDSLHARLATAVMGVDAPDRERRVAAARARLGSQYDALYDEGARMDMSDVSHMVLSVLSAEAMHSPATRTSMLGADIHEAPESSLSEIPLSSVALTSAELRVRALGPLQVSVNDVPIDPAAWGSARPRELLVFLLLQPEGSTKEQVGLALWPDASTSQLRNSFHVTTYRLRKALGGADWIQLRGERYVVNPTLLAEFDAQVFERDVVAARLALSKNAEGAVAALEQALAAYRGDLLDGEPVGDWHIAHKLRLQRLYVDALMDLTVAYEAMQRDERAREAYGRILVRDPLHESATRGLMRVHARAGDRPRAKRLFDRFSERLQRELGMSPDREMTALAERIAAGDVA